MKFLFFMSAMCPGHVDPLPRFSARLNATTNLPNKIRKKFTVSILARNYIERRILMRSATGGWVSKRPENQFLISFPLNGLTIKRCAVAFVAFLRGLGSFE